jgi:hypothetical protein
MQVIVDAVSLGTFAGILAGHVCSPVNARFRGLQFIHATSLSCVDNLLARCPKLTLASIRIKARAARGEHEKQCGKAPHRIIPTNFSNK